MTPTRGERNNNPGNIQRDSTRWHGMCTVQNDPRFVSFNNPEDGIRAMCRVLLSYQREHGLNTISSIINRWAPPTENNTRAYIHSVSDSVGIDPVTRINLELPVTLELLAKAIITHENGRCIYDDATIVKAVDMAL